MPDPTYFASDLSVHGFQASTFTAAAIAASGGFSASTTTLNSLEVGTDGTRVTHIISSMKSISFGAVAVHDSVVTTVTLAGVVAGATVIVTPTSLWSGAYNDVTISATASAASTIIVSAVNSTITSVTPAAQNFRVTAINF